MARRKIETLRDDVVRAAREVSNLGTVRELNSALYVGSGLLLGGRLCALREAVDALDAYSDPIHDTPGEYVEGSPETSRDAAVMLTPRSGSLRAKVLDEVRIALFLTPDAKGLTDEELERRLKGRHQTVSSARNWLVDAGWLIDSGIRRANRSGRWAVVWALSPAARRKAS